MAMENVNIEINIRNIGDKTVQVAITEQNTQTTETVSIASGKSADRHYTFDEPEIRELVLVNTDPDSRDNSYRVWLCAEADEQGRLKGFAIAQIIGTKDKPEELVFGTSEEGVSTVTPDVKTGDQSNADSWIWLCVGAGLIILCVLVIYFRNRHVTKEKTDEKQD